MGAADSKAAVQEAVEKVRSESVTFQDQKLWDVIINSPQSSEDVVQWLKVEELRQIRDERPRNFALFTLQVLMRLEEIIHATQNIKPGRAPHMRESFFAEVLACLRLISRLLPILLEDALTIGEGGSAGWAYAFLWENTLPKPLENKAPQQGSPSATAPPSAPSEGPSAASGTSSSEPQKEVPAEKTTSAIDLNPAPAPASGELVGTPAPVSPQASEAVSPLAPNEQPPAGSEISEEEPADGAAGGADGAGTPTPRKKGSRRGGLTEEEMREEEERQARNVGRRVVDAVMALLFCENWTLAIGSVGTVWASGVRGLVAQPSWPSMDSIRAETLRTLLIICSEPLYLPPGKQASQTKPFLFQVTGSANAHPRAKDLFFSLLNLIISYQPGGWVLNHGKNPASHLIDVASHVLLALLDYSPTAAPTHPHLGPALLPLMSEHPLTNGGTANGTSSLANIPEEGPSNIFRQLVATIDDVSDFALIFSGLVRLIKNPVVISGEAVVQSTRRVDCYQEILVLCWKLLEGNPAFLDYVCALPNVYDLLEPLLALIYTARTDSAKIGVMHVGAFILLLLSSRRSFGVALNKPAAAANYAPLELPRNFRGCHADALIHVLYKALLNGGDRVAPLYSCLLTILANVTPYTKTLTMTTADRIVTLVEFFAHPRVFFGADANYNYLRYLLETVNNIVQYQADGNPGLIYCILRKSPVFWRLFALELPSPDDLGGSDDPLSEGGEEASTPGTDEGGGTDSLEKRLWTEAAKGGHWLPALVSGGSGPPSPRTKGSGKGSWRGGRRGRLEEGGMTWLTPEWLARVQAELPLATVERMIKALQPAIDKLHAEKPRLTERDVLEYLKSTTLVGILPLPHSIVCRKYHANAYTDLWFTAYIWGLIYLRQQEASVLPIADGQHVKLFRVTYMDGLTN